MIVRSGGALGLFRSSLVSPHAKGIKVIPGPQLTLSNIVHWRDTPMATEVDREIVLMSLERGRCYGLGETGSAVWRKLAEPMEIKELCRLLENEYRAEPATLAADVLELLEQLRSEGLIEVVS